MDLFHTTIVPDIDAAGILHLVDKSSTTGFNDPGSGRILPFLLHREIFM